MRRTVITPRPRSGVFSGVDSARREPEEFEGVTAREQPITANPLGNVAATTVGARRLPRLPVVSIFSRLFGRPSAPDDPFVARLKDVPVPQSLAGTFAEGLKSERKFSHRTPGAGSVAIYSLHWNRPWDEITAKIRAGDSAPLMESVEQRIALHRDAESAHWWFFTMTDGVKQSEGGAMGNSRYGQLTYGSLPDLGDEANLMFLPHTDTHPFGGSTSFHRTHVNIRVDRMVATVTMTAVFGDPRIERQIEALARLLTRRMEDALRAAA
jgi:hypothetical protein